MSKMLRQVIADAITEDLLDCETGPLSDTKYVDVQTAPDGTLALFDEHDFFPSATFDVPHLTDRVLAAVLGYLAERGTEPASDGPGAVEA